MYSNMNNNGFIPNPAAAAAAGYMNNFNTLHIVCLWAGAFSLIQSLICIALTITGILSYYCVIQVEGTFNYGSLFPTVFLQLYFMGNCADAIPAYDDSILRQVKTILSPQDILIWECVYLAIAIFWLFSSMLIMISFKPDQPHTLSGHLWTWISITSGICAMDLALGVIFGIDFSRFNRQAYMHNLTNMEAGEINADAAQLLAGMVVSMAMLIISLKGFVLWFTNVGIVIYLLKCASSIDRTRSRAENILMPHKEFDDMLSIRAPINAYQDERPKPAVLSGAFANEGFEYETQAPRNATLINQEIIARAARISAEVAKHDRRFRNLDSYRQYPPPPPPARPESSLAQPATPATSPAILAALPAPDYTPPMQRAAAYNANHNQRFP